MKASLSPLERLNLTAVLPPKGGRYTMALVAEIVEKVKLSVAEMEKYKSDKGPDFPSIPKLEKGKEKEVEFSGWAGKLIEETFEKLDKEEELELQQYKLWGKLLGVDMAPEQEGEYPGTCEGAGE